MNLSNIIRRTEKVLRANSPAILTSLGVSGTLTTAYLTARASFKAVRVIDLEQRRLDLNEKSHPLDNKEKAQLVWKLYIPPVLSSTITVACIIGGARIGTKRTAAAYSLLTVSEQAFVEYKEKVIEQIGERKEQKVRDEIAQDRVNQTSPQAGVVIVSAGQVLCHEMHTGRYFNCDIETMRKAQNTINAQLIREMDASLSDFYYLVGLPPTSYSSSTGWNSSKMLELNFSTVLSDDGRPCLSFEYNYIKPL